MTAGAVSLNKPTAGGIAGLSAKSGEKRELLITLLLAALHLPLSIVLVSAPGVGILHPILVFAAGMYLALRKSEPHFKVALVVAYLVGVELLWRMTGVPVFWEFGKYGSIAIMVVALIRRERFVFPKLPMLYFLLLVPACIVPLVNVDLSRATSTLSFNMSGPLMLAVSCWFFYHVRIGPDQFRRMLVAMAVPIISIAAMTFYGTATAENLSFGSESNEATSGGFGANQVSAILGFGAFLCVMGFLQIRKSYGFRIFFGVTALVCAALCILTFSRGGIYNAVGGIIVLLIFGFQHVATGLRRLGMAIVVAAVFILLVFPSLNEFTGGALLSRLEDTGTTNRAEIAATDLEVFLENPFLGVGVGASMDYREKMLSKGAASHTEFARMLSEHGLFGVMALVVMLGIVGVNLFRPNSRPGRAIVAGLFAWSFLFMLSAGMRLAAPAFVIGLGFVAIVSLHKQLPLTAHFSRPNRSGVKEHRAAGAPVNRRGQ